MNDVLYQYRNQLNEDLTDYHLIQELCHDFKDKGPEGWEENEILDFQDKRGQIFARIRTRAQAIQDLETKIFDEHGQNVFMKQLDNASIDISNAIKDIRTVKNLLVEVIQSIVKFDQILEELLQEELNRTKASLKRIQNTRQTVEAYSVTIKQEARFIDKSK